MTRLIAAFFLVCLFPMLARGHVGSPNVFFDGQAGPNAVRVVIRPPATLPGLAQADVQVADGADKVTMRVIFSEAGEEAAPEAIEAEPVTGQPGLFHASLWLIRRGAFHVRIAVDSKRGSGSVVVPLNSAATQRPVMPPGLGAVLIGLGGLLLAGVIVLASKAACEAALLPGEQPTAEDLRRGRKASVFAAVILSAALTAGTLRWRAMDREFQNNALARPVPVAAKVVAADGVNLLRLTPPEVTAPGWDTLVADHGKLMHLFLVKEPGFEVFAHLHPVRREARIFEGVLPPLPAGNYRLYAELTRENGASETLIAQVALPAPLGVPPQTGLLGDVWCQSSVIVPGVAAQPGALDPDDAWHVGAGAATHVSPLMGGSRMVFQNAGELVADREVSLRFAVFTPEGEAALLQPYMGMLGHAVVRRNDGEVFTHLHPAGTISMAAQELLARRESTAETTPAVMPSGSEVVFPYGFPRSGQYRMWVQVRTNGRVVTGVFDVVVR